MKLKRYMREYANDILKRNADNPAVAEIREEIDRTLKTYARGLITDIEAMRALVRIDEDAFFGAD